MVKNSILKLCTTKYKIYNNIYIYIHKKLLTVPEFTDAGMKF